jgi:hypothetical protein
MRSTRVNANGALIAYYLVLSLLGSLCFIPKTFGHKIQGVAALDVRAAYHLLHDGVISTSDTPASPSMKREPIPVILFGGWMWLNPTLYDAPSYTNIVNDSALVISMKKMNFVWIFLINMSLCVLAYLISTTLYWRLLVPPFLIAATKFSFLNYFFNTLLPELPAAFFLLWLSIFMLLFVRRPTIARAIGAGVALACLALTKAAAFYLGFCVIPIVAILLLVPQRQYLMRTAAVTAACLTAFLAVTGVWIVRNGIEIGHYRIADRGGDVLAYRVILMGYPILGSIYAYSPPPYRPFVGMLTGNEEKDIMPGGALSGLPGSFITKENSQEIDLRKKRWDIYRDKMMAEGVTIDRAQYSEADSWLTRQALKDYFSTPSSYLVWPLVFAYKGSFFLTDGFRNSQAPQYTLSLVLVINFLVISVGSLVRFRSETCAVFIMPLAIYAFHAFFTHNFLRYNEPLTPFVYLAAAYSFSALANFIARRAPAKYLEWISAIERFWGTHKLEIVLATRPAQ